MKFNMFIAAILLAFLQVATPVLASEGDFNFKTIKVPSSVEDPSQYKPTATTLLISCVDFRLRDETEKLMNKIGLLDQYDEVAIPGASLAVIGEKHPHWAATAKDIIGLLKTLHDIKQVVILDHKDCGAYKLNFGAKRMATEEMATHKEVMLQATKEIQKAFPKLKIYALIMSIDGTVENLTGDLEPKAQQKSASKQ